MLFKQKVVWFLKNLEILQNDHHKVFNKATCVLPEATVVLYGLGVWHIIDVGL